MPHAVGYLNTCEPGHYLINWNMFYFIVKKKKLKNAHAQCRRLFEHL